MNDAAKLDITKDSFIYSVNQAYEARIKNDGTFNSHLKYEPFLEKTWTLPQNPDINSFKKTLSEIVEHHFTNLPNYRREESVNIENIAWFSHSVAALFGDIGYFLVAYTGHGFPALATPKIPRTNSSKNIILAIKKYADFKANVVNGEKFSLFPLIGEDEVNVDELYTQEIWSLVFYFIKKFFGSYADLVSLYATWKYAPKVNASDIVDWNVRPPCGDLYRKQFKHLFEKDYFKNNSKKNGPNNKEGFNKPDYNKKAAVDEKPAEINAASPIVPFAEARQVSSDFVAKPRENFSDKPRENFGDKPHSNFSDKPPRGDRFQNDSNQPRPPFRERKERPHRSDREHQQNQDEIIEKALLEVSLAVKKMHKNIDIEEIALAPQNSFIRRQQHVVISEGGFETESRGEDDSRYVCIKRKLIQ